MAKGKKGKSKKGAKPTQKDLNRSLLPDAALRKVPKRHKQTTSGRKERDERDERDYKSSVETMDKGKQMAKIEKYAKEHGISVTKAIVYFMENEPQKPK